MATDQTRELRATLNSLLLGTPNAPSYATPEAHQIDLLIDTMSGYEIGTYNTQEVVDIYKANPVPGFDVLLWIQSKVDEGVYSHDEDID